ncbi:hypothetical protein EAF00_006905 [Botryotinia globosa]|nr:hypothetical protein EAF00_006905 [Botryotinia globosa]
MAPYLGLLNGDAVKTYLESPEFHPWFEELYHAAIYPRTLRASNSKSPCLLKVQKKIFRGETFGDREYTSVSLNKTGWEEADQAQKRKSLSIDEDSSVGELLDQLSTSMFGDKCGNLIPDINSTPYKSQKQHQFSSPQSSLMDKSSHSMRSLDQATREAAEHINDSLLERSLCPEDLSPQDSS